LHKNTKAYNDGMSDGDGGEGGSGEPNVYEESGPYMPSLHAGPSIPHYYGDYVRQIFMLNAAVMLVFSPFLASAVPGTLIFEIGGAIVIAILGALTNPAKQISMLANAIAAGVGILTYELLALNAFSGGAMIGFIVREAVAVAFLFALYFSLKTLRNMIFHTIGKKGNVGEFIDS